jgi:hypothetical protein
MSSLQASENMNPVLIEVIPPFQQLRCSVTKTRSAAIQAGLEANAVSSSSSVEFECVNEFIAVVLDGVRIFSSLIICCGPVTPSEDLLRTLQLRVTQTRILQNDNFTIIATSEQRLMIEIMLQRMLELQRRVPELSSSYDGKSTVDSAAATIQDMRRLFADRSRSGSLTSFSWARPSRVYSI